MKRQRNSYSVEEKQKAMELARQTSNTYAANHYSLDLTMLGQWVKQFSQGTLSKKSSRSIGSGRYPFFSEEETQLYEWQFVIRLYQKYEYPLGMMDKMPVWFDMAESLIIDSKAPLVIIFKGKIWPINTPPPPASVVVWFQDKGWMDEPGMQKWITIYQPLDICINKPFKDRLRKLWHEWMANDIIVQAFKKCDILNCLSGSEVHLIYNDDEGDIDKSDEYNEDKEFNEDYEEGEFDEGNEDDNSNEYNKWPECFVVIEV
ncbi:22358_t:CDS:2, partial [Gigaspora margarita]